MTPLARRRTPGFPLLVLIASSSPDVRGLSRGNGSELLPALRRSRPGMKIIPIAGRASKARVLDSLGRGADGYLEMRRLQDFLPKAVRLVSARRAWVPRGLVAGIVDRLVRRAA